MKKINIHLILFLILILIFFSFSSCPDKKAVQNNSFKTPIVSETNFSSQYETAISYFYKFQFEEAIKIFTELYLIRDKNPLLSEDLTIYYFASLIYLNKTSEDRLYILLPYLSEKFKIKENLNDLYDLIYSNYTREFYYSSKKGVMFFFRLISLYVQKLYLVYISKYQNLTDTELKSLDKQQQIFLGYLYAYCYIMLENPAKAKSIILDIVKINSINSNSYLFNLLAFINIQYSKDFVEYAEYEKLMKDPEDSGLIFYSILNPLSMDYVKKEREKILFIVFHNDEFFKKSAIYATGTIKGFIFLGTFLDGVYLYDESRNLIQLIQTSNSNLYSNLIRDFWTYESRILICTYDGINVIDFSNIDMKKYNELSFAQKVQYIKSNMVISKSTIFPYGKKYSSIYEDEKYIVATTHYNGIYVYNKKRKDLINILEKYTIEKAICVGDLIYIATYQNGAYIYDLSEQRLLYHLFQKSDVKYVYKNNDFIYFVTYKDGIYRARISDNSARYGSFSLLLTSQMVSYVKSCVVINNNLYIGSLKNGLYIYNLISGKFQNLNTSTKFFSDNITSLIEYNGFLLISSLNDGVAIYNQNE
ncbi:MAG TPA: hypothetical protein PLF21_02755 [Exilispira sp.]|nr:hypothetical protein [Exilispira sp.]